VPFFKNIRSASGFTQLSRGKYGSYFSSSSNPRARGFAIYQGHVSNIETMKEIIQLNKYRSDNFESFVSEDDKKYLKSQSEKSIFFFLLLYIIFNTYLSIK
jgi:hypothetical protein